MVYCITKFHDDVAADSLSFFILGNPDFSMRLLLLNFYTVVPSTEMLSFPISRESVQCKEDTISVMPQSVG